MSISNLTAIPRVSTQPAGRRLPRLFAAGFVSCALLAPAVVTTTAEAAKSAGTTIVYAAPTPYSSMLGGIFGGTPITMRCWIDGPVRVNGTPRFFRIEGMGYNPRTGRPNWLVGYASASTIANQSRVGHC